MLEFQSHGGQLDENQNLPTVLPKKENLHYLYNSGTQTYDIIDLSTGKQVSSERFETSSTKYTLALCDYICDLIRNGTTLKAIGEMDNMPSTARIYAWESVYPEFKLRVQQARKQRAETFADKALELALTPMGKDAVPAAKLAVDTLKWRAEKADPDNYGAKKVDDGPKGTNINITLHTGVLDSPLPKDIIVDAFGNFKGFDGDVVEDSFITESDDVIVELKTDRFQEIDNGEEDDSGRESKSND